MRYEIFYILFFFFFGTMFLKATYREAQLQRAHFRCWEVLVAAVLNTVG